MSPTHVEVRTRQTRSPIRGLLQRKCACGTHSGEGKCEQCREGMSSLRPRAELRGELAAVPPIVDEVLRETGRPLEEAPKHFMETRLGHDFSQIRVHDGPLAAESARAIHAHAYTVGHDIVFGSGRYKPHTKQGRHLLAHELTHATQQGTNTTRESQIGWRGPLQGLRSSDDHLERQSEAVASAIVENGENSLELRAHLLAPPLQRQRIPHSPNEPSPEPLPGENRQADVTSQDAAEATDSKQLNADELSARIVRCIGIWETNRGRNEPAPKESDLDTVAGVHASMATIEQATMPYAITVLKKNEVLRAKATPPLTLKELNEAEARCKAVVTLLGHVRTASEKGNSSADLVKERSSSIAATGLSEDDVATMFKAVNLQNTLKAANVTAQEAGKTAREKALEEKKTSKEQTTTEKAAKKNALEVAIDAIPADERLDLGKASLRAYSNKPSNWGEHRAGWQRKAVNSMSNNVGARIEAVAVSDSGTALIELEVKKRVDAELSSNPVPNIRDIVEKVAQKNNPGEREYGKNVWRTYERLYN